MKRLQRISTSAVFLWDSRNRVVHSSRPRFAFAYLNSVNVAVMPVHTITPLFRYGFVGGEARPKRHDGITADLLPSLWICQFRVSLVIVAVRHRTAAKAASKAGPDSKRTFVSIIGTVWFDTRRIAGVKARKTPPKGIRERHIPKETEGAARHIQAGRRVTGVSPESGNPAI